MELGAGCRAAFGKIQRGGTVCDVQDSVVCDDCRKGEESLIEGFTFAMDLDGRLPRLPLN